MEERPHVVLFPYPVQGHINPMFTFARSLASLAIEVTFVHTAGNYELLQQQQQRRCTGLQDDNSPDDDQDSRNIHVEAIPEEESKEDQEEIKKREQEDPCYEHSMQRLERGFEKVVGRAVQRLQGRGLVKAMVADVLMPWTRGVAKRAGIQHWYHFSGYPALTYVVGYYVPRLIDMGLLPLKPGTEDTCLDFLDVGVPLRLGDVPLDFLRRDLKHLEVIRRIFQPVDAVAGVVVNTVHELEASTLEAMQRIREPNLPVYPVGPLLSQGRTALMHEDPECMTWLDRQPPGSVVYVAFGRLASLTSDESWQLAHGLEASGLRFLWAVRQLNNDNNNNKDHDNIHNNNNNNNDDTNDKNTEIVPPGFAARTRDRGLIVAWSPQARVLAHPSVTAFITHCGYSSMLEALSAGVPMIGYPKLAEQNTNLRLISEWGIGIPLPCPLSQHDVVSSLHCIIHGEQGRAARHKASQVGATVKRASIDPHSHSKRSLRAFASLLTSHDAGPQPTSHPPSSSQ